MTFKIMVNFLLNLVNGYTYTRWVTRYLITWLIMYKILIKTAWYIVNKLLILIYPLTKSDTLLIMISNVITMLSIFLCSNNFTARTATLTIKINHPSCGCL